jgi:hypothetical protein
MAAVELEDLAGSVEVVVFPRTYQLHRDALQEDAIVLVKGKVDTRDDQPKLLCESVELFEVQPDELAPEDGAATQTAYPLDATEAEASGFDGGTVSSDDEPPPPEAGPAAEEAWGPSHFQESPDGPEGVAGPDAATPAWPAEASSSAADGAGGGPQAGPEWPGAGQPAAAPDVAGAPWEPDEPEEPGTTALAPGAGPGRTRFVLELHLERSAREERDVGRLVRLNELLDRYPGDDRVVLHILALNGRDGTAIELAERVECCAGLIDGVIRELGEEAVRVRAAPPPAPARPAGAPLLPVAGRESPAPVVAGV